MKRITFLLLAFFTIGIIIGCGSQRTKEIDVDKITTTCDCVDKAIIVSTELASIFARVSNVYELSPDRKKEAEKLMEKGYEIEKKCYDLLGVDYWDYELMLKELEKCPGFEELERLAMKIDRFIGG